MRIAWSVICVILAYSWLWAFWIVAAVVLVLAAGCAQIPFARTYSLNYSDGKESIGMSVRLEPPSKGLKK